MTGAAELCDAHVHLYDRVTADAPRLLATMDAHGVRRAAVVTPSAMKWDNGVTLAAARAAPERLVAIGRLDLSARDCAAQFERELAAGLRGLRIGPASSLDLDSLLAPQVHAVWQLAADAAAPVHVHLEPTELRSVAALVERFRSLRLVLDHLGRPDTRSGARGPAFRAVLALADHPHTWAKTPAGGAFSRAGFPYRDLVPFLDAALDAFGPSRIMWGSDWPGCLAYGDYELAAEPVRSAWGGVDARIRRAILVENFDRLYPGAPA